MGLESGNSTPLLQKQFFYKDTGKDSQHLYEASCSQVNSNWYCRIVSFWLTPKNLQDPTKCALHIEERVPSELTRRTNNGWSVEYLNEKWRIVSSFVFNEKEMTQIRHISPPKPQRISSIDSTQAALNLENCKTLSIVGF